jgi:major membrane immunogen (membrane-anchored lipoprotein)
MGAALPENEKVARLNDELRQHGQGGLVVITRGIQALGKDMVEQIAQAVREYDAFDSGNDPHGERDFGSVTVDGEKCFWKIDYYDQDLKFHSPDKSDPNVTKRVLTIMLASEY